MPAPNPPCMENPVAPLAGQLEQGYVTLQTQTRATVELTRLAIGRASSQLAILFQTSDLVVLVENHGSLRIDDGLVLCDDPVLLVEHAPGQSVRRTGAGRLFQRTYVRVVRARLTR